MKKSIKLWLILAIVALLAVVVPAIVLLPGCTISDESTSSSASYGTVAGSVKDADTGNGIYDAKVKVVTSSTSSARAVYSAQTDSDGNYSITDIPPGTHQVTASKSGHQNVTRSTTVQAGETTTEAFTLTAVAGGTVSGRVTDVVDSTIIIGARVYIDEYQDYTDNSGDYMISGIPTGTQVLHVEAGSFVDYQTTLEIVEGSSITQNVPMAENNEPETPPNEGKSNIYGRVYDSGGAAVLGAEVQVYLQSGAAIRQSTPTPTPTPSETPTPEGSGETDSYGTYEILNVDPGTYNLLVTKTGYTTTTGTVTATEDKNNRADTVTMGGGPSPTASPTSTSTIQPTPTSTSSPGTGVTTWVSKRINSPEVGAAQDPDVNDDGTVVVFTSAGNVITTWNSPNAIRQIYGWNSSSGTITRLSNNNNVPGSTAGANNHSDNPRISGDGAYVAFQSTATDILAGGISSASNGDVYYVKLSDQSIVRVSQDAGSANAGGDAASTNPDINGDGSVVVFQSLATNIGNITHTAGYSHIYFSAIAGSTPGIRQMIDSHAGVQSDDGGANPVSQTPRVSWDGRYTVFVSDADTNICATAPPGGGIASVILNDIQGNPAVGWNNEISISSGTHATADCLEPCIDQDGNTVAFATATVWTSGNALQDVWLWKSGVAALVQVSKPLGGLEAASGDPDIDKAGKYVIFETATNGLVTDAPVATQMIYAKDVSLGTNVYTLVSRGNSATVPNVLCNNGAISGNGNHVVWETAATNCTSDTYTAAINDVFVRKWQ
ncbi:MAG: carboxypeptidase regulatory-like domain-containing protein [Candidatus Eremiobacteraeota bacterium]|nr:carboxypeptidase regulatory-like domain-containing protein [Candidatus Eremiobacteraeota bacterium]